MVELNQMGPLSRANKAALPRSETIGDSVFTLHHWSANQAGRDNEDGSDPARHRFSKRRKSVIFGYASANNVKLLSIKAQESALNFLFGWVLVDESERVAEAEWQRRESAKNLGRRKSIAAALASNYTKQRRRSSSLLGNISKLPDRRIFSIVKFIFWRWLTWANFLEFILVILLINGCIYQCYELLEDYFSYPTHVSVNKILNDDYLTDLPGLTICNKNRMSRETLRISYPELNDSHFMAITLGTFYSVNNFTLHRPGEEYFSEDLDDYSDSSEVPGNGTASRPSEQAKFNATDIDWIKVSQYLTRNTIAASHATRPLYDLIDTITCANIWGDQMPCQDFKRLQSFQQGSNCVTLFHDSVLWDSRDPAVRELKSAFGSSPSGTRNAEQVGDIDDVPLMDLKDQQLDLSQWAKLQDLDPTKVHVDMGNMEMIRLRINFRPDDYANKRSVVGGQVAVHPNTYIATINHIAYNIEPGFWYSYYLERFDFKRLPPPYKTNCYDYQRNRYDWIDRGERNQLPENRAEIHRLIKKQALQPNVVLQEYADNIRTRSMGKVGVGGANRDGAAISRWLPVPSGNSSAG